MGTRLLGRTAALSIARLPLRTEAGVCVGSPLPGKTAVPSISLVFHLALFHHGNVRQTCWLPP